MKKLAVFDVDGTIFRSSLLIELVDSLVENEIFPDSTKNIYKKEKENWENREGTYEDYIKAVIEAFMKNIKGVPYKKFQEISTELIEKKKFRIYRYTRGLVKTLKKEGYFLLAISQSPKGALDSFCDSLGFDKVYGRFYELGPQDRFTGGVQDVHLISNKANILKRVIEKEDLTLEGSIGVGDTEDDIPFLEKVKYPVCFNPNKKLYKKATLNGWQIVIERKDVFYYIPHEPKLSILDV